MLSLNDFFLYLFVYLSSAFLYYVFFDLALEQFYSSISTPLPPYKTRLTLAFTLLWPITFPTVSATILISELHSFLLAATLKKAG